MKYIFPFGEVNKDENIVLYGAGNMGYQFYRQIMSTQYCKIVCWVDKQYDWYREMALPVDKPENIKAYDFDKIVIAVEQTKTYESIVNFLKQMGVDEHYVVWKQDMILGYDIAKKYDKDRVEKESQEAYQEEPYIFLSEDRMDLVVRYLYAVEILENIKDGQGQELYEKYFLKENGGVEPMDEIQLSYFTEYSSKCGIDNFKASFQSLVNSMKEKGFDKKHFVPLDKTKYPVNGSHRIAAALATENKVWAYSYGNYQVAQFIRPIEWFRINGFSENECDVLLNAYRILMKNE